MTTKDGDIPADQPPKWKCMVPDCRIFDIWQPVLPGERYYPSHHPKSHYAREHYPKTEKAYRDKLEAQREKRIAHYRATGQFLPPEV